MNTAKFKGEGHGKGWTNKTCFFNREKDDPEERDTCAFPPPPISGLAASVFEFFKMTEAAVKHSGMSGQPGYRDRKELEALARAHRMPWTERMLLLFKVVEDPWIVSERRRMKAELEASKNAPPASRGRKGRGQS